MITSIKPIALVSRPAITLGEGDGPNSNTNRVSAAALRRSFLAAAPGVTVRGPLFHWLEGTFWKFWGRDKPLSLAQPPRLADRRANSLSAPFHRLTHAIPECQVRLPYQSIRFSPLNQPFTMDS